MAYSVIEYILDGLLMLFLSGIGIGIVCMIMYNIIDAFIPDNSFSEYSTKYDNDNGM